MTLLKDIQRHVGVTADGVWGPNTARAIMDKLGMSWRDTVQSPPVAAAGARPAPPWVHEARQEIGVKEIVGPKHNPEVLAYADELDRPYSDDETPWCGLFVGAMLKRAGYPVVDIPERALSWAAYGTSCEARVGAIAVKPRVGGNHVFILTGVTADGLRYKGTGGNQSNAVTETDFLVSDVKHLRWPPGAEALPFIPLPIKLRGTISSNEA